ncbi:MAG: ATP synthase F1 subunit delta [Bacteroidales bacterium]|nr:ATP synthase F1 subunit delta [Bacteroidales bacterium]
MKGTLISNRYAKALFELALENNLLDPVKDDMESMLAVCRENKGFTALLRSPVIKTDKKLSILTGIFKNHFSDLSFRFIVLITKKGREYYLQGIAEQYIAMYREHNNIVSATLTSAADVDDKIRDKVTSTLRKYTKAKIELTEEVDPALIGGFILTFGDRQYDASLIRQIKRLKKEFNINLFIKGY